MIILNSVSKEVGKARFKKLVLDDVTCVIPARSHVVILGHRGAGKTTLLDVMAGSAVPTRGWVERRGTVSVPRGLLRYALYDTPYKLIERMCEIYRADPGDIANFTSHFMQMDDLMNVPVSKMPGWLKSQLNITLTYAFPCDFYLFDGSVEAGRKREFRDACRRAFELRSRQAGTVVVTNTTSAARSFGSSSIGGVLFRRKLTLYERLEDAIAVFENLPDESEVSSGSQERAADYEVADEEEVMV
jgi:capsular polysaccharide transport system ATP-binding protein